MAPYHDNRPHDVNLVGCPNMTPHLPLGPLMLDLAGTELSAEERELLGHPAVGGVILFSRNDDGPEPLRSLTAAIHAVRTPPLLIGVDQEGGRVQRFRNGFSRLPPAGALGALYQDSPRRGSEASERIGWLMAAELRAVGVDFSFAPVLDLDRGISSLIGDRAFAGAPETVAKLAAGWLRGVQAAGMAVVGKHFPGHGGVGADSHHELPRDDRPLDALRQTDLIPFERLIALGIEGIMPAHLVFPRIDPLPAGFSPFWLTDWLRGRLGFDGAIFSDDLSMQGAAEIGGPVERAQQALAAGCDMVLLCNDRAGAIATLANLDNQGKPAAARLQRMQGRPALDSQAVARDPRWPLARRALAELAPYAAAKPNLHDPTRTDSTS